MAVELRKEELWAVLSDNCDGRDDLYDQIDGCDTRTIIATSDITEETLDLSSVVEVVDDVLHAQQQGYKIVTWFGAGGESLVAGVKPAEVTIKEDSDGHE
mgnify:CR=1 FL=1